MGTPLTSQAFIMAMTQMNRFSALDAEFKGPICGKVAEKSKEAKPAASPVPTMALPSVCPDDVKCSRCSRKGHYAKDCKVLKFTRDFTRAEMRMKNEAEKAEREAQKEAKQAEYEEKKAAWAERAERQAKKADERSQKQAAWAERQAKKAEEWDTKSDISRASTAVTATLTLTDEQELEVCAFVAKDKEVRRLQKLLREIAKLEQSADLDALQQKKANRKPELEMALETACGLAAARARNHVRQQTMPLDNMC